MIYWWRKIICFAVVDYTFSRILLLKIYTFSMILLSKSYIFSRITPCTLYWIQKVPSQKSFIHPSTIQQISLSLLTTKSAKELHAKEANQELWIHRKHEKAPNSSVRSLKKLKLKPKPKTQNQNLNHYSTTNLAPKPGQGPHGHSTWTIGLQSVDIQQPSETASASNYLIINESNWLQSIDMALFTGRLFCCSTVNISHL